MTLRPGSEAPSGEPPLVSIVVPIYKVEPYLRRCVDSLLAQTYPRIEIILVDDGSPDGCPQIVDEYAAGHPYIVPIHQVNKGLGPARNAGIEAATGDFLAFVDSDDYVKPDYLRRMVQRCLDTGADICVCNFAFDFASGAHVAFPLMTLQRQLSGEKAGSRSLDLLTLPVFAWNKLYRRELFTETGIRFPAIFYEDMATISQVLAHAHRVAVTHRALYHYCLRETSITGKFTDKNLRDYLKAVEIIRDFIWDSGRWEDWARPYLRFLVRARLMVGAQLLARPDLGLIDRIDIVRKTDKAFSRLRPPPKRPPRPAVEVFVLPVEEELTPEDVLDEEPLPT